MPCLSRFIFNGVVSSTDLNTQDGTVELCVSEEAVVYTTADQQCNIRVGTIDDIFDAVQRALTVTIVTPNDIIENARVTSKTLIEQAPLFRRKLLFLCISFIGSREDQDKLRRGTPFQLFIAESTVTSGGCPVTSGGCPDTCKCGPNCQCGPGCQC